MSDDLRAELQSALAGTYHLEQELGGGGMSRVFLARDETLGRDVVIKVLSPDLAATLSAERFTREIRMAAALQEPHIVPLLSAGATADGVPYYTMPFVRGDSLRARMMSGALTANESLGILRNVAQALAYAHERDIVHRDIKPENVLLSSGTAVVTDFGIAKALSASTTQTPGSTLTSAGVSIGTPAYMAPEQAVGDASTDLRADLYAWGVLAYEMLSGGHPFASHSSPQALVTAHLTETPAALSAPNVPAAIRALVMQCLAKEPSARPASARDILRVLDSASAPNSHSAALDAGHSRMRVASLAALIIALIIGGALLYRTRSGIGVSGTADRSIAVLPFENGTRDSTQEYFADGITEELIGRLATIGMRVTGRNSVFTYKGQHPAARVVGTSLHVGSVLTGTVRRAGERLLVSVELANATTDSVIWSFSADRPVVELLAFQKDLVDSIAARFRLAPTYGATTKEGTTNLAAREAYTRGRYLYNRFNKPDIASAIVEFDRAIALDPKYPQPHAGKAYALGWLADGFVPPTEVIDSVRREVQQAIALDSMAADGWVAAALQEAFWGWDWKLARRQIDHAKALNPNIAELYFAEMAYQLAMGDVKASSDAIDQAYKLDPLSGAIFSNRVYLPFINNRPAESIRLAKEIPASMQDAMNYGDAFPGMLLEAQGLRVEAESSFVRAERLMGHRSPALGIFYLHTGRTDSARKVLADIEHSWPATYIPPELVARLPAALNDTATMYRWLERGLAARSAWAPYLSIWQLEYSPHRSEPHFQSVLARVGVKDAGRVTAK